MKSQLLFGAVVLIAAALFVYVVTIGQARASADAKQLPTPDVTIPEPDGASAEAVFAGGCFWCVEAYFEELNGVTDVVSGYAGGRADDADYKKVSAGVTEHAEAVKVTYDPTQISYGDLLQVFFTLHNPMEGNGQQPDYGSQYRPSVFYGTPEQLEVANAYIEQLNAAGVFDGPIQTGLEQLNEFYLAEEYHQDFVAKNPEHPYVVRWALPKIKKVKHAFPSLTGEPVEKVEKSDAQWRKELSAEAYNVLRQEGTERPFTSPLNKEKRQGTFVCAACELPLFASDTKFELGTGWPSFYEPIAANHVTEVSDTSMGMTRTEVQCARCGGHQGHIFNDGPKPTGLRYCINGVALKFVPAE